MTLREVIDLRIADGAFNVDPDNTARVCSAPISAAIARPGASSSWRTAAPSRWSANRCAGGGWVATHQDITEERRRESSFRFLFEDNPLPMWVWDHATFRFLAVNKAAVEKYGYDHEQFRSLRLQDIKRAGMGDARGHRQRR